MSPTIVFRSRYLITGTLVFCLVLSVAYANHQWSSYHWERKDSGERIVTIGNCHTASPVTNTWSSLLTSVVGNWNTIPGYGDVVNFGLQGGAPCGQGDVNSYNGDYGNNGWLGIASISVTRGKNKHIVRGESKVNEYYATLPGYHSFNESNEWEHVLCQEIGHTFGLDHNRDGSTGGSPDDTCMNDQTTLGLYTTPNVHDGELLEEMYAHHHGGGGGGGGGGPPGGGGGRGRGGAVSATSTVAHVFWAEQYASDEAMFEASDLVVNATVVSSAFNRNVGQGAAAVPVTRVVLRVNEAFRGLSPRTLFLEQTRGPNLEVVDDPGYVQGDEYTLFLRQIGPNIYRTVNPDGRIRQ